MYIFLARQGLFSGTRQHILRCRPRAGGDPYAVVARWSAMVVAFPPTVVMGPRLRGDDSGGCGNNWGSRRAKLVGNAPLLPHLRQRLGVDQHEGDGAGRVGAVAPGVIGAALDQHVAGFATTSRPRPSAHRSRRRARWRSRSNWSCESRRDADCRDRRHGRGRSRRRAAANSAASAGRRSLSGGYSMMRKHAAVFRRRQSKAAVDRVGIAAIVGRRAASSPTTR